MTTEEPPLSASTTSLLDKPLHQLTEDDISQLTREDCRRYLKQKGMRRPSWNKSQAIQQVVMLKALLEPTPDSDGCRRKLHITHLQQETPNTRAQKGTSADTEVSVSADESVPGQRHDMDQSDLFGDNNFVLPGITGVTDEGKGQMTIFYSGKVNVYDDVPADKAQTLFKLASSPLQFHQDDGNMTTFPLPFHLQPPTILTTTESSVMHLPTLQTVRKTDKSRMHREEISIFHEENSDYGETGEEVSGRGSRKASVQRYLEKRKDRFKRQNKLKASECGSSSSFHHVFLTHHNENEQSLSTTTSPPNEPV
ncbi:protein TIFY 4B isoform X1 [Lactuca sativa]|uniref:protein TIFY 4B isoform X1 n=1 Tax=Lactuca sativa TaxID=4236 RepID=UPI000CD9E00E|nr:protein TIFY 4B isoform X1 [Lactuca sativa]